MTRPAAAALLLCTASARADSFDHYTLPVLTKALDAGRLREVAELTPDAVADAAGVLHDAAGALVVVKTNDNRVAKLLVQAARQKVGKDRQVPLLLVERYATFRGDQERALKASGRDVQLYPGSRLHLDLGQVVPESVGGDIAVSATDKGGFVARPVGSAKLYLVTNALPEAAARKGDKYTAGDAFEVRHFTGTYKLRDDGRRSGALTLRVSDEGDVEGTFVSDKDGAEYEVTGKAGNPRQAIAFTVELPRVEQTFKGLIFTGDGKVIAGTSKLQEREAAFVAERSGE